MFGRTVGIDYQQLQQRCKTLCDLYQDVVSVEIKAPAGTELVIPVAGRKPFSDDGDFSLPGTGGNVPAGEVFISPVVGDGKDQGCCGRIVYDGSMSVNAGCVAIKTPIVVDVVGGFITNISGGAEAQKLLDTITQAEEEALAMGKDGRLSVEDSLLYCRNARNIGELGIGLNPAATITGNMLEDEKAFRTCHIAIGENYDNDAHALIHLDGVIKNPTIDFVYTDGSRRRVLEDGVLTF
jgi:leucyl aminopeptidase (aminopeptidase T)